MRICALLSIALTLSCASQKPASKPDPANSAAIKEDAPTGQLPSDVTPLHYALDLKVDPALERFSGKVRIVTKLDKERSVIWLHGEELNVTKAFAQSEGEEVAASFSVEAAHGVAKLAFDKTLPKGEITLVLEFDTAFRNNLNGLYKVVEADTAYAFTQFESHFARKAFPCFDEPRFKTPYDITLEVKKGDVGIATAAEIKREEKESSTIITYATTENLPTYLIAFAVGPLDVVEGTIAANGVRKQTLPFRGVAAKGKGARLKYALENTAPLLAELENYFGVPYPFDKLDIIAVPDFASGAMENVGAVTFREYLLLVDEKTAPISQKQAFNYVMAHELAHMWFGNLVTMPWWDDIWLNEAFATWMGMRVTDNVNPTYKADVGFLERVHSAMRSDSLVNARQIRNPIESTGDIRNAFDSITYSKGGGVLAMFETFMGREAFQKGLQAYMNKHRYGSATYKDLLNAFQSATTKEVVAPFESFLFQPGVPMVKSEVVCDDKGARLRVEQSRYLPVGSSGDKNQTWMIPLSVNYKVGKEIKNASLMLKDKSAELPLGGDCPIWVLPNAEGTGYYRWSMPEKDLQALMLGMGDLKTKERVSVASSLKAAFDNNTLSFSNYASLMNVLVDDKHRAVSTGAMGVLNFAKNWVFEKDLEAQKKVEAFGRKLYAKRVEGMGFDAKKSDSPDDKKLRANLLSFQSLAVKDSALLKKLAKQGRAALGYSSDKKVHLDQVNPDLLTTALLAAVHESDAAFYEHVENIFKSSDDARLRNATLQAMSATQDSELAKRARALVLSESVRGNEMGSVIWGLMYSRLHKASTWAWFKENYSAIKAKLPDGRRGRMPQVVSAFCDAGDIAEASAFFDDKVAELEGGARNFALAKESAGLCVAKKAAHEKDIRAFFKVPAKAEAN